MGYSAIDPGSDSSSAGSGPRLSYRIAYAEAQRTLDDQVAELTSIRDRVVTFLAFVAVATGVLVSAGVGVGSRDGLFYLLAAMGTCLTVASIGWTVWILSPYQRQSFSYRQSATDLISWLEPEIAPMSDEAVLKTLVGFYEDARIANENYLAKLRQRYFWAVLLGALSVCTWASWVWARG